MSRLFMKKSFIHCPFYNCKNQIVFENLRIVAQLWTLSESHVLRLYFGIFQHSVVLFTTSGMNPKSGEIAVNLKFSVVCACT